MTDGSSLQFAVWGFGMPMGTLSGGVKILKSVTPCDLKIGEFSNKKY
jgi:hypothetical protein